MKMDFSVFPTLSGNHSKGNYNYREMHGEFLCPSVVTGLSRDSIPRYYKRYRTV
jgi:hypothetical protein